MKSKTLPSFWSAYYDLSGELRNAARKAYKLWNENPFHRSLHFKCINREGKAWSFRITKSYRAVGYIEDDTVVWFWIGNHDDHERFFG